MTYKENSLDFCEERKQKETKIVIHPYIARRLLKRGYMIVDIKAQKEDSARTLFVFYVEGCFMQDFSELMEEYEEYLAKKELEEQTKVQELEKRVEKNVQRNFRSRFYTR